MSWSHSGAASAKGLKLLEHVGDQWGMDGVGGIRVAGGEQAVPVPNIGRGFLMAARERASSGSVTGVVAVVMCCCCGQVSTFQRRGWVLSGIEATAMLSEIDWVATTKKWEVASEFVDGKTVEL